MKNKKQFTQGLLLGVLVLLVVAWTVTSGVLNSNQFFTTGNRAGIKNGALTTNQNIRGLTVPAGGITNAGIFTNGGAATIAGPVTNLSTTRMVGEVTTDGDFTVGNELSVASSSSLGSVSATTLSVSGASSVAALTATTISATTINVVTQYVNTLVISNTVQNYASAATIILDLTYSKTHVITQALASHVSIILSNYAVQGRDFSFFCRGANAATNNNITWSLSGVGTMRWPNAVTNTSCTSNGFVFVSGIVPMANAGMLTNVVINALDE